ncbi:hypothetical protein HJFPF1_10871 [Paramyrothecium foliicola]|nr:hypothetical protein HJFPF1_10871 [Paramyrothecium foliicola]
MMSPNSKLRHTAFEWESHRERIEELYRGNSLPFVIRVMREQHHFDAPYAPQILVSVCIRSNVRRDHAYKTKFRFWGIRKSRRMQRRYRQTLYRDSTPSDASQSTSHSRDTTPSHDSASRDSTPSDDAQAHKETGFIDLSMRGGPGLLL